MIAESEKNDVQLKTKDETEKDVLQLMVREEHRRHQIRGG